MKRYSLLIQLIVYIWFMLVVLLAIVGGLYYQTSSQVIRQKTEQTTRDTIGQGGQFVSSYIQRLKETTTSLATSSLVQDFSTQASESQKANVKNLFDTVLQTDSDLSLVALITKSGQVVATDDSLIMQTSSDMMNESWYQEAIDQEGLPVLTPARKETATDKWVISVTQEVVDTVGNNLGVIRLDLGYTTLETYLDQLKLGKKGFPFIIDQQGNFVYHPQHTVYSSSQEMAAMQPYLATQDGYTQATGESQFVYQYPIPNSQWTLVGVASLDELHTLQGQIFHSFLGTGVIALLVSSFVIWILLRRWIRPIRDLQETILQVGKGHSELRAKESGAKELVDLSRQFNTMLDQIDTLMKDIKQQEQETRQYELQALSSQINPHFLYNTLDTIVWMAEFNDGRRVVEITKSLAKYFRLALNKGNELITLKDELDHVGQYLFIQQQRYGDRLNYEIAELESVQDYLLPKLVLQPLVENAIYHGIKESERKGLIQVSVTETTQNLVISVYDNGKGMEHESSQAGLERGGVGLANVNRRLQLQFGEAYHMEIQSELNHFTRILLYLPK